MVNSAFGTRDGNIVIAGTVYSDEGSTVSTVCDNSTQVVHLMVEAAGSYTGSCNSLTGAYTISNVSYNPGDNLTVYLDTNGGRRGANISTDPSVSISGMDIYENRVIVRHEDTAPLTIADMAIFDHDSDSDIPFNATDAGSDTLVVEPDTKLIVWTGKTFAPAGDITLQSGGSGNVWDGSLQLFNNAVFSSSGTQSHTIGGNLTVGTGASLQAASTTFTFTATTTGKTITTQSAVCCRLPSPASVTVQRKVVCPVLGAPLDPVLNKTLAEVVPPEKAPPALFATTDHE